jgi:NADH:ubiquinone oxidoreductase subunit 3 (subunit A)
MLMHVCMLSERNVIIFVKVNVEITCIYAITFGCNSLPVVDLFHSCIVHINIITTVCVYYTISHEI